MLTLVVRVGRDPASAAAPSSGIRPDAGGSILRRRIVSLFCAVAQSAGRYRGDNFCPAPGNRQRHRSVLRGLMVRPHQIGSAGESEKDRGGRNWRARAMRSSRIAVASTAGVGMERRPGRNAFGGNRDAGAIGRSCRLGAQAPRRGEGFGMDFSRATAVCSIEHAAWFLPRFSLIIGVDEAPYQLNVPSNNRKL